jgi:hypothetical protein
VSRTSARPARWLLLLSLLAAGSCGIAGVGNGERDAWERALARWSSVGPGSYTYTIRRRCFCGFVGPVRVTVSNGTVTSRIDVDSGLAIDPSFADAYPDVFGLFAILDDAIDRGAFRLEVTYDPSTGVPVDFWIDYSEMVADEELGFTVDELPAATP